MRLALPTSHHEVASSSYGGGEIPAEPKQSYIASAQLYQSINVLIWLKHCGKRRKPDVITAFFLSLVK